MNPDGVVQTSYEFNLGMTRGKFSLSKGFTYKLKIL